MKRKIVFVDLDGVLADFYRHVWEVRGLPIGTPIDWNPPEMFEPGFFAALPLIPGAKKGLEALLSNPGLDIYIASKPVAECGHCAKEKYEWIAQHFPELVKKIFLACDKTLLRGDYLIDDDLGLGLSNEHAKRQPRRVYFGGTAGRHRHHRSSHGVAATGAFYGDGSGTSYPLRQ